MFYEESVPTRRNQKQRDETAPIERQSECKFILLRTHFTLLSHLLSL